MNRPKIFGVGYSKTGTTTLGQCLRALGYRHCPNEKTTGLLARRVDGEEDYFWSIVDSYESFDDWPWPRYYQEMAEKFPDARFVLTRRRNTDVWFRSLANHAYLLGPTRERELAFGVAGNPRPHRKRLIEQYEAHLLEVREYFRDQPERLLEICWEEGDGWAELCNFLGEEVPERPLPRSNATHWMVRWRVLRPYQKLCRVGRRIDHFLRPPSKRKARSAKS